MGAFDGGLISSDGGALLLGATDEAIGLVDRFAACFRDGRAPELIGHSIATLVRRRVVGIVLGYEDLIDHDELRHDPVMAVLALPLYIFCGRHLLAAKLRRANIDASAGAVAEIARIVAQIRAGWPKVKIRLRADSGFAREELISENTFRLFMTS